MTARYVPHQQAWAYFRAGWSVWPLPMPHGAYSVLVVA